MLRVWLAMLLLSDSEGMVEISIPGLAKESRVSIEECKGALAILEAPDPESQSNDEEGRRLIRPNPDIPFWVIVNYQKYRKLRDAESRREYHREYMRDYRAKKKGGEVPLSPVNICEHPLSMSTQEEAEKKQKERDVNTISAAKKARIEVFESWWSKYPRKVKKQDTKKLFLKLSGADVELATGPVYDAWLKHWGAMEDQQFIPYPPKWISGSYWESDPPPSKHNTPPIKMDDREFDSYGWDRKTRGLE